MTFFHHLLFHLIYLTALVATARTSERAPGGLPRGWSLARMPDPGEQIRLNIALRQQNVDHFDEALLAISTPGHPRYGEHLTGRDIKALLRPTKGTTDALMNWLDTAHVHEVDENGDWIHFRTNVSAANKLLDADFRWYESPSPRKLYLRTLQYSLPDHLTQHVDLVQPTTRFGTGKPLDSSLHDAGAIDQFFTPLVNDDEYIAQSQGQVVSSSCARTIYPSCLFQLYKIKYKPDQHTKTRVAFASFLGQNSSDDDIHDFENRFVSWSGNNNVDRVSFTSNAHNETISGNNLPSQLSTEQTAEANLDAQYLKAISTPIAISEFSTTGRGPQPVNTIDADDLRANFNEPYLEYLLALRDLPDQDLPQTISHSYGEPEDTVPESYVRKVCQMFGELGARGVSVIFASGDSGVGTWCANSSNPSQLRFQSMFPAACPTVTSVGSTRGIPESAAYFSSGGFSHLFPQPGWQVEAVQNWLDKYAAIDPSFDNYFNSSNRAFPDVSTQGYRFAIMDQAELGAIQGTSASAPVFAGIVGLLNSARVESGRPPLGFLNPWLYGQAKNAMNDIINGTSTGCNGYGAFKTERNGSPEIAGAGWNATEGWDPVTGLGTPDFDRLLMIAAPGVRNDGGPDLGQSLTNSMTLTNSTTDQRGVGNSALVNEGNIDDTIRTNSADAE